MASNESHDTDFLYGTATTSFPFEIVVVELEVAVEGSKHAATITISLEAVDIIVEGGAKAEGSELEVRLSAPPNDFAVTLVTQPMGVWRLYRFLENQRKI